MYVPPKVREKKYFGYIKRRGDLEKLIAECMVPGKKTKGATSPQVDSGLHG